MNIMVKAILEKVYYRSQTSVFLQSSSGKFHLQFESTGLEDVRWKLNLEDSNQVFKNNNEVICNHTIVLFPSIIRESIARTLINNR